MSRTKIVVLEVALTAVEVVVALGLTAVMVRWRWTGLPIAAALLLCVIAAYRAARKRQGSEVTDGE